jgi:hypothetical protein
MSRSSRSPEELVLPQSILSFTSAVMSLGFVVAGASILYLLFGLFFGLNDFGSWEAARQRQMLSNIDLAGTGLLIALGVASLCVVLNFWYEETAGYVVLVAALLIGIGLPMAYPLLVEAGQPNRGILVALSKMGPASILPGVVGGILVLRDLASKMLLTLRRRTVEAEDMQYGKDAHKADRPIRMSLMAKCWEGAYCRDFVRAHCPIFIKKATCWKERRGCYCEEEIVSTAAMKTKGLALEMAPDSRFNNANPSRPGKRILLSDAQKVERCRNCIVYNEHQRDKYKVLLPIVVVFVAGICFLLAPVMREWIASGMTGFESAINRFSFSGTTEKAVKLTRPNETAQWIVVIAFSVMVLSKTLQTLEWAVFEKKW